MAIVRLEATEGKASTFCLIIISVLLCVIIVEGVRDLKIPPEERVASARVDEGVVRSAYKKKSRYDLVMEDGKELTMEHMRYVFGGTPVPKGLVGRKIKYSCFNRGDTRVVIELISDGNVIYSTEEYLERANAEVHFWWPLVIAVLGIVWFLCLLSWKFRKCIVIFGKKIDFSEPENGSEQINRSAS